MTQLTPEAPAPRPGIDLVIRPATAGDLPGIMAVEEDWPEEQRAPREKFESRLRLFPDGVLVAAVDDEIVGVTTSCLTRYDVDRLEGFTSWDVATNDGWITAPGDVAGANAVYVVSTGIKQTFRGLSIFPKLIGAQVELSRRLGLRYCVTGAILEGYGEHCREYGAIPAGGYAFLARHDGMYLDPLLRKLQRVGFEIPDRQHVLPEYFASEDAHDWSVLMVVDNAREGVDLDG